MHLSFQQSVSFFFVYPIYEKVSSEVNPFQSFPGNHASPSAQPPVPPATPRKPPPPRWAMGCAYALLAFVVLALCSGVYSATWGRSGSGAPAPTATDANVVVASSASKPTATRPAHSPTATPTPAPTPTHRPTAPAATPRPSCQAVNHNPWCYTFSPGNLIYHPPAAFCTYFPCLSSFWNGRGYVNECVDGAYSKSGGIQGDCSHHGGELRPLYSH